MQIPWLFPIFIFPDLQNSLTFPWLLQSLEFPWLFPDRWTPWYYLVLFPTKHGIKNHWENLTHLFWPQFVITDDTRNVLTMQWKKPKFENIGSSRHFWWWLLKRPHGRGWKQALISTYMEHHDFHEWNMYPAVRNNILLTRILVSHCCGHAIVIVITIHGRGSTHWNHNKALTIS